MRLSTGNHDRDIAGLTYVYPVVSRRARGVSVGLNLNPNRACNFRCVYCQVPGLVYGKAPQIDLLLLREELEQFLATVLESDWMERCVPEGMQRLNDIAFSGDGEPTSAEPFERIVETVGEVMVARNLIGEVKLVLITNGSLVTRADVARGIERMAPLGGEVWFKVDRADDEGLARINSWKGGVARLERHLVAAAKRCRTLVQTCVFSLGGAGWSDADVERYLALLARAHAAAPLAGVLLYGLARPSMQPEADRLGRLPAEWLERLAGEVRARVGIPCEVFP